MDNHQFFFDFLQAHTLAVISTVSPDSMPEAAVIGFGQTRELELLFGTSNLSRKYQNLMQNSSVACVIGWEDSQTVQYEGTARELREYEFDIIRQHYWKKVPSAEAYHGEPTERYFIVTPTWIRFSDYGTQPYDIKELRF